MIKHTLGPPRIYRYSLGVRAFLTSISIGFFAIGIFFLGSALVGIALGKLPSGWGGASPLEILVMGVSSIFASGGPMNFASTIGINGYMMVRIYGIKWVTIPWEAVQEPIPLPPDKISGISSWVVPVQTRLSPWHSVFGYIALRRLQPAVWINSSLHEHEQVLQTIERHLQEHKEMDDAEEG